MITFKQYIAEQEDKATSGFDKDKNGNVFIAHDTSFERKKEKEKKKDTNESIIKKVKKAFGVKADHEKSLAEHAAGHNKEDHSEHLSSHSADAHKDPHERKAFDHFKRNSTEINEHLIDNHKSSLGHRYGKKHADEHKEKNKKHRAKQMPVLKSIEEKSSGGNYFASKRIDSELLKPITDVKDNYFKGKRLVFTGDLQELSRAKAAEAVRELGADINTSISKKTEVIVLGRNPGPSKMDKIKNLIEAGVSIRLIEEPEFLELINAEKG